VWRAAVPVVGRAAVIVGRAAVPAIDAKKTTSDGTKLPLDDRALKTTTYGMKSPLPPELDHSDIDPFLT
jgi:hypothetical protein